METIHLYNLSNLCRVCLTRTEIMSNLFDSPGDLPELFRTIINIELEKNETLPNYLCSACEDKLIVCQDFVNQCKKTEDLLRQYKQSDFKVEEDTKVGLGSVPITRIVEFISNDEVSDDGTDDPRENGVAKRKVGTRKTRTKQFSHEDVIRAIEKLRNKFNDPRRCIRCSYEGRNFRALSVHMSFMHKDLKDKWCGICNDVFDDIKSHLREHDDEVNSCEFCGRSLSSRGHLIEHIMSHTTIRPHKCESCDKTFVSARHLRIHAKTHESFPCIFCETSFPQRHSLRLHLEAHRVSDDHAICIHCKAPLAGSQFFNHKCVKYPADVSANFVDTNIIKQNYCAICSTNVRSLSVHNKNFHEDKAPDGENPSLKLCTVCGKQFKNNSKLKVHMRMHTGETPYSCSYCDRKMSTRNHLVVHERTHTGERPHVCHICNKAFSQTSILNTHMKIHTGRPEACMICDKKFCRRAELRLHMRKHTGEKPFVCPNCDKNFVQKSHLVEHVRRHTDDKPFKCYHCEKSFRQRSSLKTHMQIHLGQKPFKCTQCPYACRQSHSLTVHMRRHGDDKPCPDQPHACDHCNKTFTTKAVLSSHVTNVHLDSQLLIKT